MLWMLAAWATSVAVVDLENRTGDPTFDPAGPGTSAMLVTKLAAIEPITVVERSRLTAVLDELELSQGHQVDEGARVQAGKLIGADFMVFGHLLRVRPEVLTVHVRVVDTETAEVVKAENVVGAIAPDGSGYFELVDLAVRAILDGLEVTLTAEQEIAVDAVRLREVEALLKYGSLASETPKAVKPALWRDTSKDMMGEFDRTQYAVFTASGARVPTAEAFARLVGDEGRLAVYESNDTSRESRRARREARWPIGRVYTPEEADTWIQRFNASQAR